MPPEEILEAALAYAQGGLVPIRIARDSKTPVDQGWQNATPDVERIQRDFASGRYGIGLLNSDRHVDVDLDWPEARVLASKFLPDTDRVHGHASSLSSHRWYIALGIETMQLKDPTAPKKEAMIVEIRSAGTQTVVPPSIHEDGEPITWERGGEPAKVEAEMLRRAVLILAAVALMARHWLGRGSRHAAAMAWAGFLLRHGLEVEQVRRIITLAARAAGDEEWRERAKDVKTTHRRLEARGPATGGPTLEQLGIDPRVLTAVRDWLGLHHPVTVAERAWGELLPLPTLDPGVPAFDFDLLPEPFRAFVEDATERIWCPPELIAAPLIVSTGAIVGRQVSIRPKRHDDGWTVIPILWGAAVARPGALKSPSIAEALGPLHHLVARAREAHVLAQPLAQAAQAAVQAQLDALKKTMASAVAKGEPLVEHQRSYAQLQLELEESQRPERRYLTHDPTVEKLCVILNENPRGMLLVRDELVGFLRTLDKQGREGDREFYLEAWDGDHGYTVDRIGRGTVHVPALCVSLFGGIQPAKLEGYVASAVHGGAGDDGLLQRLQLLVWPDAPQEFHNVDRPPNRMARERVFRIFDRLEQLGAREPRSVADPIVVHFDAEAQGIFDEWRGELEARLRSGELDNPAFESHLAKYRSLMPTLALLFHLVGVADRGEAVTRVDEVDAQSAERAVRWCQLLEAHGRRVYGSVLHRNRPAYALAQRIERGHVEDGMEVRALYRRGWTHLATRESTRDALDHLAELGWLRVEELQTGGRPSQVVRLHPELLAMTKTPNAR